MQQLPDNQSQQSKKKSRKWLWVIGIVLVLIVIGAIANIGNHNQANSSTLTSTAAPTKIPTLPPTPTSNPLDGPVFGGTLDAFTAKYGQPSNNIGGLRFYQNLQVDFTNDTHLVDNMLIGIPHGQSWTMAMGIIQCNTFLPADAVFVKDFPIVDTGKISNGIAKIYISRALGSVFPTNKFIDQQHQLITPGTFTVAYTYHFDQAKQIWDENQFLQCEIDLGIPDYLKTA